MAERKRVVTREYDDKGRLVKETTVYEDAPITPWPTRPAPYTYPNHRPFWNVTC